MFSHPEDFHRVVITGIDGSGKSTAASQVAHLLSSSYPDSDIRVADSSGVSHFRGGEVERVRFNSLSTIEPSTRSSKLETVLRMGAFTAARQGSEYFLSHAPHSLTLSVRDPFRIDVAAHMPVIGPEFLRRISPERRLRMLNSLTLAAHPTTVAFLRVDLDSAISNATGRDVVNRHETPEKLALIATEFPQVLEAYQKLYEVPVLEMDALKPNTADMISMAIEQLVPAPKKKTSQD